MCPARGKLRKLEGGGQFWGFYMESKELSKRSKERPRKRKEKHFRAFMGLWLTDEADKKLDALARERNDFKSALIRKAVDEFIEKNT